jgi:hypothetical protein
VESLVGYVRRNLFVPLPASGSFEALNAYLDAQCRQRLELVRPGRTLTIGERLELPLTP